MCEPDLVAKTGLSVREHIDRTVGSSPRWPRGPASTSSRPCRRGTRPTTRSYPATWCSRSSTRNAQVIVALTRFGAANGTDSRSAELNAGTVAHQVADARLTGTRRARSLTPRSGTRPTTKPAWTCTTSTAYGWRTIRWSGSALSAAASQSRTSRTCSQPWPPPDCACTASG